MVKAVIDVGSNSVLTLVAEARSKGWKALAETTEVTGLGKGTKTTMLLSEDSVARTLGALERGYKTAREHGASEIVAAATMAARIATNTPDFLARAESQGTPVSILSGEDEARLGFLAVANDPLFAADSRISIIDVGGHSTELVTADREESGWNMLTKKSYPVGALGLREGPLRIDTPNFRERLEAVSEVDDAIGHRYLPGAAGHVVTLGATGTNLVTIREGLREWNADLVHGAWLDYEEVSKAVDMLCSMDDTQRSKVVGIEKGREHTLHAGALILERFLFALGAEGCTVSVRGWRHALLETLPM